MTYSNPATQGKKITIIFGVVLSVLVKRWGLCNG